MDRIFQLLGSAFLDALKIIFSIFGWVLFCFGLVSCVIFIEDKDPAWAVAGILIAGAGLLLPAYIKKLSKEKKTSALYRKLAYIDIECPGCGAVSSVRPGGKKTCEYCGRILVSANAKE